MEARDVRARTLSATDVLDLARLDAGAAARAGRAGRYELGEVLGEGGMGIVYRGVLRGDGGFERAVAIKRLRAELAHDARHVAMLLDEAKLAARVRSAHVVEILDVVHDGGEFFLVMPLVRGASLDRLMAARGHAPLDPDVAAGVVVQVLRGLAAVHGARDAAGAPAPIVHRDVSPSNIHVGADGVVRLLDFGIAQAGDRMQARTKTGDRKGKPSYMAPEQLLGGDVDPRADLFSAGVVLVELLTGERLYPNEILLAALRDGGALPATVLPPGRPRDALAPFRPVLEPLLAVSLDGRAASAQSAAVELESLAPGAAAAAAAWARRAFGEEEPPAPRLAPGASGGAAASVAPARGRRRVVALAAAALAAGGLVAVGLLGGAPPASAGAASAAAESERRGGASASAHVEPEGPPPIDVDLDEALAPAAPSPSRHVRRPVHVAPKRAPSKPDCKMPFTIAPDGTKVPRPECF